MTTTTRTNNTATATARQAKKETTYQTMKGSNLTYIRNGNVFEAKEKTVLVPVNAQGTMRLFAKSMAGLVAKLHPRVENTYIHKFQHGDVFPGSCHRIGAPDGKDYVLLTIWKHQAYMPDLKWIASALDKLCKGIRNGVLKTEGIATIKIGCGSKGLKWEEVGRLMALMLGELTIPVSIYVGENDPAYFPIRTEKGQVEIIEVDPNYIDPDSLDADDL